MGFYIVLTLFCLVNSVVSYNIIDDRVTRLLRAIFSIKDCVPEITDEPAFHRKPCSFRHADVGTDEEIVGYINRAALSDDLLLTPTTDTEFVISTEVTSPEEIDENCSLLIPILKPCPHTDMAGQERSFNLYVSRTAPGLPEYGIKPVDPFSIPRLVIRRGGVTFSFTNIKLFGLKFRQYLKFKIDRHTYYAVTREYPVILADLSIKLNCGRGYSGTFRSNAITTTTMKTQHVVIKRCDGSEYFDIRSSFVDTNVDVQRKLLNPELEDGLNDPTVRSHCSSSCFDDVVKEITSEAMEKAYDVVMDNLRKIAKLLSVKAFYTTSF